MNGKSIIFAGFSAERTFFVKSALSVYAHKDWNSRTFSVCTDYTMLDVESIDPETVVFIYCEKNCVQAAGLYFRLRGTGCYTVFYSVEPINSRPLIDFHDDENVSFFIAAYGHAIMEDFFKHYYRKEKYFSPVARQIFDQKNFHSLLDLSSLSYTERSYLYYLAAGISETEMRGLMHCSRSSIDSYRYRIYQKLGIDSRFELLNILIF